MPSNDQLLALVQSHSDGDDSQFYAVAMQLAAREARNGRTKLAQELRDLVDTVRKKNPPIARISPVIPLTQPRGEMASLLSVSYPSAKLSDLVLSDAVRESINSLISEQRQKEKLIKFGLTPSRRVLFVGAPGTGKTSTANALAGELGLPLFTIRFDTLITKYMGETAAKLRMVFDALTETRGVYLFDEVDAVAGDRSNGNDVGEIRRVLNSFLQFLDQDDSDSVIVAATNHPRLLDHAIFRRFDQIVKFTPPRPDEIQTVIINRLTAFNLSRVNWTRVTEAAKGLNHADICAGAETAAKKAVISGKSTIPTESLVNEIKRRPRPKPVDLTGF